MFAHPNQVGTNNKTNNNVALGVANGRRERGGNRLDLKHLASPGLLLLCLRRRDSTNNGEHVSRRLAMVVVVTRRNALVNDFLWGVSHGDFFARLEQKYTKAQTQDQ